MRQTPIETKRVDSDNTRDGAVPQSNRTGSTQGDSWRCGLAAKITLPIAALFIAGVIVVALLIPELLKSNTIAEATLAAEETVAQFKTLRKYYVENVISKVIGKSDVRASADHAGAERTIPLPATLIHDMSERLEGRGTSLKLYSGFPFPNRSDRVLDDFGKNAWEFLNANPDDVFTSEVEQNGRNILRVAIADRMVAQACVACHNSHPQTPKTGWKVGDVRGVLEVDIDISNRFASGKATAWWVILIIASTLR